MKNKFFLFFSVLTFVACSNQSSKSSYQDKVSVDIQDEKKFVAKEVKIEAKASKDVILPNFKKNYFIKGKEWKFNENNFLVDPMHIIYNSGNLVLLDKTNEYNLKYIDVKKRDTIIYFGKRGKGPLQLGLVEQILKMDNDSVSVWDYRKQMLFTFSLSNVKQGKKIASSYIRVRNKNFTISHLIPYGKRSSV